MLFHLQIESFIQADLEKGLEASLNSRRHHNTTTDDWDRVQETVSGHLQMTFLRFSSGFTIYCYVCK